MTKRNDNIDVIKAFAIISVILIHGLSNDTLYDILAPYYIWQTVPVFMILVGFNSANSFMKKGFETLSDIFAKNYLLKKAKRILLPFAFVWLFEILIQVFYFDTVDGWEFIRRFIVGGYGPGSYFVPLIIQATILTPLIYVILKKQPTTMMILLFVLSFFIDMAAFWLNISGSLYRLLIIRHLFSVTLGVWFALVRPRISLKWLAIPALLSFVYITAVHYFNWELLVEEYWHSQHAPSYFYVLVLIIIGLEYLNLNRHSLLTGLLILVGKASYHIFLTQMVYFWFLHERLPDFGGVMYLFLLLTIPILTGIVFYYMESYFYKSDLLNNENR